MTDVVPMPPGQPEPKAPGDFGVRIIEGETKQYQEIVEAGGQPLYASRLGRQYAYDSKACRERGLALPKWRPDASADLRLALLACARRLGYPVMGMWPEPVQDIEGKWQRLAERLHPKNIVLLLNAMNRKSP